jgi:[ribosomal protein S5]-alanine N-acetyltransferase
MSSATHTTIRPWTSDDLSDLVALADNVQIWNRLRNTFPHPYTRADGEAWLLLMQQMTPVVNFAIEYNGTLAGGIGLILNGDVYVRSAEVGYWIGEPYWGLGIATEALRQMVHHSFIYFDIVRLYAEVFENNKASMRVLEKNGFYLEGVRRKAVFKNDQLMDDYIWVLLRSW